MILRVLKQVGLVIFCCGVMALSAGFGLTTSAIAAPTPLAAMEEMAEDATTEVQETAEEAKKAVEEGVEKAKEDIEETKEATEDATEDAEEKSESIIDKVKSLFTGE